MDHFIKVFKKKHGRDIRSNNRAVQKLRREVEKAKRTLSSQHQTRIEIESFYDGEDFSETLTRARFEELNMVSSVTYMLSLCVSGILLCLFGRTLLFYFLFSGSLPINNETSATSNG